MKAITRGLGIAALCLLAVEPVSAAGPFDGIWTGRSVTDFGWCPQSYEVELRIRDGKVAEGRSYFDLAGLERQLD